VWRELFIGTVLGVTLSGCYDFANDLATCRMEGRCWPAPTGGGTAALGGGTASAGGGTGTGGGTGMGGGTGCTATTCANGCCNQGQCQTAFPSCGSGGSLCSVCDPYSSNACGAGNTCACGSGPACDSHKRCVGNACECVWPWKPCASGCCPVSTGLLSAGTSHTCALTPGGGVKCWGDNGASQLGNGMFLGTARTPAFVIGLDAGVAGVTSGEQHSCAWMTEGGVKCWGANDRGQLGQPSMSPEPVPIDVVGLPAPALQVAAGYAFTCALLEGGTVACWGDNQNFELTWDGGDFSTSPVDTGLTTAVGIAANSTPCALLDGGAVACWGAGQEVPTVVGTGYREVAVGGAFSCGLTATGALCWGDGSIGGLGDGTTNSHPTPTPVMRLGAMQSISCGGDHACAAASDGTAFCWGYDFYGQCGSGAAYDAGPQLLPIPVQGLPPVIAIATGLNHTCAMVEDGNVLCWGSNSSRQLGAGTDAGFSASPLPVTGL
jgi:alpha-tubulin suppressor-like RCC1 family protein